MVYRNHYNQKLKDLQLIQIKLATLVYKQGVLNKHK